MGKVVLMGGGVESLALSVMMKREHNTEFDGMFVAYGNLAQEHEEKAVEQQCKVLGINFVRERTDFVKDLQTQHNLLMDGVGDKFVNGRNIALLLLAARSYDTIYIGSSVYDLVLDSTPKFLLGAQSVIDASYNGTKQLVAPFINRRIENLIPTVLRLQPNFFDLVWNCWTPVGTEPCGICKHCKKLKTLKEKYL